MTRPWITHRPGRLERHNPRHRTRSSRAARRPTLEALEDRSLPSLFGAPLVYPAGPPPTPDNNLSINGIAVGDLTGNGRQDIVTILNGFNFFRGGQLPSSLNVLLNKGDGTFAAPISYSLPQSASVVVGDFRGLGRDDVALVTTVSTPTGLVNQISVLPSNPDGTLGAAVTVPLGLNLPPGSNPPQVTLAVADFNGDGKQDLVALIAPVTTFTGVPVQPPQVSVFLSHGDGTFAAPVTTPVGPTPVGTFPNLPGMTVGDFNGDGRPDVAVAIGGSSGNTFSGTPPSPTLAYILRSNPDGTFAAPIVLNLGSGGSSTFNPTTLAAGDVSGHGRTDLVVSVEGELLLVRNNGDGTFAAPIAFGVGASFVAVGDFNGDGKNDLFTSNGLFLNNGDGTFTAPVFVSGNTLTTAVGHLRGPKALDVVTGGQFPLGNSVTVYLNTSAADSTAGTFDPATATWYLRNQNSGGAPDVKPFQYGGIGWKPVLGDWNGDGVTTAGVVDPLTATWYLRKQNSGGTPDSTFAYGMPGWIPVVGDWTGSGHTGIGMFDPKTGTWYLRNSPSGGAPDFTFRYGLPGWLPVVGDWDGNGTTTVGVVDPSTMTWYLTNENVGGGPDVAVPFPYGPIGATPITGDWTGSGKTGSGIIDSKGNWFLRISTSAGSADITPFPYGLGTWTPL